MKKKFKKGSFVYVQGRWKCGVIEDLGDCLRFMPLEGFVPADKGKIFTAAKSLFKDKRNRKYEK